MKKLLVSLMAISLLAPLSAMALEKPATPDVDIETIRIEESMGEHPQERLMLKKKLAELDKEVLKRRIEELGVKAKKETGKALEKIKAKLHEYKDALKAKLK